MRRISARAHLTHLSLFPGVITQALDMCAFAIRAIWEFQITLRVHPIISNMILEVHRVPIVTFLLSAFSDGTYSICTPSASRFLCILQDTTRSFYYTHLWHAVPPLRSLWLGRNSDGNWVCDIEFMSRYSVCRLQKAQWASLVQEICQIKQVLEIPSE